MIRSQDWLISFFADTSGLDLGLFVIDFLNDTGFNKLFVGGQTEEVLHARSLLVTACNVLLTA